MSSLQFDGMHVEHRADANLVDAMERAAAAVTENLGYTIRLKEKELFAAGGAEEEENAAVTGIEDESG